MAFSGQSNDQKNFECVTVASVDFIKLPLKDILESRIKPSDLSKEINSCSTLLAGKYELRKDQLKLCFPPSKAIPDYSKFDVTLLYTLTRNLCPSLKPTKGWGTPPDDMDVQIGDDIERLRLFRNNYYAHADSAAISDADFKDIWKNLKSVVSRIQNFNKGRNIDYEQELMKIESNKIAKDHLESCKLLLEALMNIQKQTDEKVEPKIFLGGEDRVICGGTARFEANVRNVEYSCWHFTWQKRTGNRIECIDINQEKYKGSTKIILLMQHVCKEDEGEYQAVLSRESNGIEYKISSNTVCLHALGELPILNDLKVTTGEDGITVYYGFKVLKQSPEVKYIKWCKNGETLDIKSEKYIGGSLNDKCLTITSPNEEDRGKYSCTITNAVGSVSKEVIFGLPNITTSGETDIRTKSVKLVGNVFVYDGSPDILEVFWTRNGERIQPQQSGGRLSTVTVENPSLIIRDVNHNDAGEYKLTAKNAVGTSSSDIIVLGAPNVSIERLENEGNGRLCFRATIKAIPSPCSVQWNKKGNDEDDFKPIDANAEEYRGTNNFLPHPELVVKQRNLLENNCFQIEVANFVGGTVEKISNTRYQVDLVCNLIPSQGHQRVLLDCCLYFLINNLKNPDDTWTKEKIVTHVRKMISKLVENNEKDRLENFCQHLYQDESLSNTLLKCGEEFYSLIFSMEEKYNAQDIMISKGSFCVTFCFDNNLHLENYLKKLESKDQELIKDLSKITLNKTLLNIFGISSQNIWWTAWTVNVYRGNQFFERIFTYPIEGRSGDSSTTELEGWSGLLKEFLSTTLNFLDGICRDLERYKNETDEFEIDVMRRSFWWDEYHLQGHIKESFESQREFCTASLEKMQQYRKSLEEINIFETKGESILSGRQVLERSRLERKFFSTTRQFLDDFYKNLQTHDIEFSKEFWILKEDILLRSLPGFKEEYLYDKLETYQRTERNFYHTSLEKTRLYRRAFEEIETLETMMNGGSSEFAIRYTDAVEKLGKSKQELEQMNLIAEEKHGKLFEKHKTFEIVRGKLLAPGKVGSSVYARSSSQDTGEKLEKLTQKFHHTSLKTVEKYGKSVEDVERLETKGEKMSGQTQGGSSVD